MIVSCVRRRILMKLSEDKVNRASQLCLTCYQPDAIWWL